MASMQNAAFLIEFVKVYQAAGSPQEIADTLKIDKKTVTQIAQQLRKKGVNLQKFRQRILTDAVVADLQKLTK